eukprot:NODE_50_length_31184_cov_0.705099.p12 type:complete len:319 gc:universal NODE_50_length_31184_cov_0.705099:8791-7835(-)
MVINVKECAKYISEHSDHVKVDKSNIQQLAKKWKNLDWTSQRCFSEWNQPLHPCNIKNEEEKLNWILLLDTLNFSFFADENSLPFTVNGYTGYWSLCAALKRAYDSNIPICNIKNWDSINWRDVFKSDNSTEIPLLEERMRNILETMEVLKSEKYLFSSIVNRANNSALALLELLFEKFKHFQDFSEFKGKNVYIMKRAQILIADIWASFEGKGYGQFHDIGVITMFADYRVPQSLAALGMIVYDEYAMSALKSPIAHNEALEVEIRGNSIHSVELLKEELSKLKVNATSISLDFYLWKYAKERTLTVPIHKTRCIYY